LPAVWIKPCLRLSAHLRCLNRAAMFFMWLRGPPLNKLKLNFVQLIGAAELVVGRSIWIAQSTGSTLVVAVVVKTYFDLAEIWFVSATTLRPYGKKT